MQRDKSAGEERLVFLFQGESETVDDRSEYLQQLRNTVVALGLVDELEEDVRDRSADECSKVEEFPVDPVKRRFQEVPLSWVFAIEQLE